MRDVMKEIMMKNELILVRKLRGNIITGIYAEKEEENSSDFVVMSYCV